MAIFFWKYLKYGTLLILILLFHNPQLTLLCECQEYIIISYWFSVASWFVNEKVKLSIPLLVVNKKGDIITIFLILIDLYKNLNTLFLKL